MESSVTPARPKPVDPSIPSTEDGTDTPAKGGRFGRRFQRPRKPIHQRWRLWILMATGAVLTSSGTQAYRYVSTLEANLPDVAEVNSYARDGTMTIKAADGSVLQYIGPTTRDKVTIDNMPEQMAQAFVASEDRRFYRHEGVDFQGIARAAYANFQEREVVEGASTITQQLARIVFLDQDRTYERKLREVMLARKIERDLSKASILERYLNLVYLGSGAYGVADAAWVYFSKPVDQLTLPEMAMIAGLAPAPSEYSPMVNPDAALTRRNLVLRRMEADGFISAVEADQAVASPLDLNPNAPKNLYSAHPYFTSYVQQQLTEILPPEEIEVGGLTVETTMNPVWQQKAEEVVKEAVDRWGGGQRFEQAALVSIDPRNGQIKALVGGTEFGDSQFNRATQAQRQPGSTFKAFVYTTAIAAGFSPYKTYADAKYVVDGYEPKNYGGSYSGNVSMREALTKSVNIVAVKVLVDVGFQTVIDMASRMGVESELLPTYSLALGASEVNLLELTGAYGTLAAEGMHHKPRAILKIYNRYGDVIYDASDELKAERAVDAESAAIVTWMLQGVVQGGTGSRAAIDRPVAGKTGTSERNRDLWFVGYIPQVVTGVWLGNDDSSPTWGVSSTAAATWRLFMRDIVDGMEVEDFPERPNLNREGTIEAQPVKPGRVTAARASSNSRADDDDAPSRSRSYSSSDESESESSGYSGGGEDRDRSRSSGSSSQRSGSSSREEKVPTPERDRSTPKAPPQTSDPANQEPAPPSGSSNAEPAPPPAPDPAPADPEPIPMPPTEPAPVAPAEVAPAPAPPAPVAPPPPEPSIPAPPKSPPPPAPAAGGEE